MPSTRQLILAAWSSLAVATAAKPSPTPTENKRTTTKNAIIPYYVYPEDGSWDPLYSVIAAYPDILFTVIVNPNSGPSTSPLPGGGWLDAVTTINLYDNTRVIGYVLTDYGDWAIADVEADIVIYAGWLTAAENVFFAVDGIFLDEGVYDYTIMLGIYYSNVVAYVKDQSGLGPDNYIVMNPGIVLDQEFIDIPDVIVVYESPYTEFETYKDDGEFDALSDDKKLKLIVMVYNILIDVLPITVAEQALDITDDIYLSTLNVYTAYILTELDDLAAALTAA